VKKVYLRAFEESDVESLVRWRNDLQVTNNLGGSSIFVSGLRERDWVFKAIKNDKNDIRLAICLSDLDKHIGNISLTSINWINRSAEYSIFIGEKEEWGKGYASDASRLILDYGFKELNLHRIHLTVKINNLRAIKLYENLGFIEEGVLRESVYKNGKYTDMMCMAILKSEYIG
jgi:RimJ/RimL family protein N-acetyltransferase